jgi:hypothetical protein
MMRTLRLLPLVAVLLGTSASAQVISSNTTWSGAMALDRDVRIEPGVTVTVSPGAVITATLTDAANLGNNSARVEIIVLGTLNVNGATFTSTGSSAGGWAGLRIETGGTLTATSAIIEEASSGIAANGTVTVSGSTLRGNTNGVQALGGTATVNTSLFTGNSYAVYGQGGSITVDHSTLVQNTNGVYSTSSSGSLAVNNSIITNNSSYGLYKSSTAAAVTNSNDCVWQNGSGDYVNVTSGSGNVSANPLFVASGSNYRLTSNSPARKSDSAGMDLGAFPYTSDATPGLYGTLWVNTTVSTSTSLAGDLTVAPGVTLTVNPGVTLTMASGDVMISGNDSSRGELIVRGTLVGNGSTFTSAGSSAGSWTGIRVEGSGSASFVGATIEEALYALDVNANVTVTTSTIRGSTYGVRAVAGSANVATTLFAGNSYAVYGQGGTAVIDHSTLVTNTNALYSTSSSGSLTVNNSIVTNNSSYGLYKSSTAANVTNSNNDVWQNGSGDYVNVSAGGGSISTNPLFVSPGSNYRLTSNSPARNADAVGGDLGAFPWVSDATPGLVGTLWSNVTLSSGTMTGDLVIPAGVTVTVPAGVTLTAASNDALIAGNDTSRVELIIRGTLNVTGMNGMVTTFTSSGSSAGSWTGVRIESGGTLTASGLVVEEALYGLDNSGTSTVTSSTLRGNTYGARAVGGTASLNTSLFTGNAYAVYGQGGAVTVDHGTLVSNTNAIYSTSSSGSLTVTNSVITNNSSYGLYKSSTAAALTNSYNDVWQNGSGDYVNVSAGTGSFSSNPLFVASGSNYRLTSNSPARKSDATGQDLGAFPYISDATPGLYGTLWTSTTVNTSATLGGDLIVPAGVTLTVGPGVTLIAPSSDIMIAGNDTSRTELIVRGTLTTNGAVFTSSGSSAGAWTGVRIESGATVNLTNTIVEEALYGLDNLGTATVNASTVRGNTYGLRANSGSTLTVGTTLFTGNSYGGYGQGGVLNVDHSTFVSNTNALYSTSSSGSITVSNSVITNNSSYGLYKSSTAANVTNSYNDVWQNGSGDYVNVSAGTGSISSNPLFVAAGSNYRLTSNSPARRSDSVGGDMGAFPYTSDPTAGLVGTLWVDTTLTANATLLGDLTVGPGVTLTVAPGITLTAGASDLMIAGNDTSRVELIVRGTLTVNAASSPAVFTSTGSSAGSWTGIRVESGAAASLTGVSISRALYGIDALANVTVNDSSLSGNTYGLRINSGSSANAARSLFTGNAYGVYGQGGVVGIDHSTFVSNTNAIYSTSSSGSLTVSNSVITNNSSYGLYKSSTAANITNTYNDVWQNGSGDYVNVSAGTGSISSNPLFVASGSNYRLTSNSPARKSDSLGGDMGAFPYLSDATPGLVGTLWTSLTLGASATLQGDLTIAPGVTVTIAPGVTLTAPSSDLMIAGNDTSRTELIVLGTLQVSGTPASPVVLTSTGSAGSWTGVRVMAGGTATITSATIQRGLYCLDLFANATVSSSRLNGCTYGVRSNAGTATVNFSVFDANSYGIYGQGGAVVVDHATLYGNTNGLYSTSSTGSLSVINSIFSNHSSYGMYRSSTAAAITNSYNLLFNSSTTNVTVGSNSLSVDPLFVAPASADFRLQSTSPARLAGTSASDLGAFPFAPGTVDRVVVTPLSATVTAGATFTFTATAYDASNNPVPSATFTWSALASAGVVNSSGVLTASCTPGSISNGITATSNGRSGSANVTINTAPIASLVVTPGNATVRSQQSQQFSVMALDVCGNPVASPAVTWVATGSAGIIDASGQYTAGCTRGAFPMSIVATAGVVTGRASVTVDPGVLSNVSLSPTSATLAVNGTRQFTGSAADGCGNPLTSTISYATTVPGGNVNTAGLFSAGATPGTFNAGLTATASEGTITRSASANLTVTGGAVATVTVMPSNATLGTGATMNFMAIAVDSLGNMIAGTPTWSVVAGGGTINASTGSFTAGATAGTFTNTVQATIAGVSGFATVIVQPGAVTRVVIAPMSVTLAPSGTTTFTAQAMDANNNVVTAPVTWAATVSSGVITQGGVFTAGTSSGNYPAAITATVNGISGTANVSINAGALAQLTITPSVATTQAGGTVGFTATGRDGNGNSLVVTPTWSVVAGGGTISTAGVFSAGTMTGTFANTVRAESNGVTAFATVTVSPGPLSRLELTPTSATLEPGALQQFSAVAQDAFGNPVGASVTWSANSNAGSISAGGLFTAGSMPGDYLDGVTATSGNVTATASIRVGLPMVTDAGTDAGTGETDAGVDAGMMMNSDAGMNPADGGTQVVPDGGSGNIIGNSSGCGCSSSDAMAPLFGLLLLALRRRRLAR